MREELIFNASDKDDAPESPILHFKERKDIENNQTVHFKKRILRFSWMRDEFIFSASDNDAVPSSPMLFQEKDTKLIIMRKQYMP